MKSLVGYNLNKDEVQILGKKEANHKETENNPIINYSITIALI